MTQLKFLWSFLKPSFLNSVCRYVFLELDFYDFNKTYLIFASLFDGYDNGTGRDVDVQCTYSLKKEKNQIKIVTLWQLSDNNRSLSKKISVVI